jgi:tetratricopeptide (TPR) repeat protein
MKESTKKKEHSMEIFISYSWNDSEIADTIENDLNSVGIKLIRDKNDTKFKDSFKDFMKKAGDSDYALMLISDSFLKSINCMNEVLEVLKNKDYEDKILPIILNRNNILKSKSIADYINYWENEHLIKDKELCGKKLSIRGILTDELEIIYKIQNSLSDFFKLLKDRKSSTLEELNDSNYKEILEYIGYGEKDLLIDLLDIRKNQDEEDQDLLIESFINENRKYFLGYYVKGEILYKREKYKKAIKYFSDVIELDRNFFHGYYYRGIAFIKLGLYEKGINDFSKSIEIYPEYAKAYFNRGSAYGRLGKNEKSLEDYTKAIEINPEYAKAYYNRGIVYWGLDKYEKSIEDYTKAIKIKPELDGVYCNRGASYSELGNNQKAIEDYTKAIEINPDDSASYNNRGIAYVELGEYENGLEDFSKAIALNPEYAVAYCNRGEAYEKFGKHEKAESDFKIAKKLSYEPPG